MKMKTILTLFIAALIGAVALTSIGCESIADFKEDNPVAYDVIKGTAKAVLLSQVPQITDSGSGQFALRTVINAAFDRASAPGEVALALQEGVASVYPNDASLQRLIVDEWVTALTQPADPNVPASSQGMSYNRALAAALSPDVVYDYSPDVILFGSVNAWTNAEPLKPEDIILAFETEPPAALSLYATREI
jgi:hypothetical protein